MGVGRAVGYGVLALVDALVPTAVAFGITLFTFVGREVAGLSGLTLATGAAATTFGLTLVGSALSHARGGSPFAFTRLAKVAVHYFVFWPPWALGRRRRR